MSEPLETINTVGWKAEDMQNHVFNCHDQICELRARAEQAEAEAAAMRKALLAIEDAELDTPVIRLRMLAHEATLGDVGSQFLARYKAHVALREAEDEDEEIEPSAEALKEKS